YFLWTDGKLGAYVRYVADGQRFGFHEETLLEALEIPLGEDVYVCPECGKETGKAKFESGNAEDADDGADDGSVVGAALGSPDANGGAASTGGASPAPTGDRACPGCGAEVRDENVRKAPRVTVPRIVGAHRVPNGQEV